MKGTIGFPVSKDPTEIHTRTQFDYNIALDKNVFLGANVHIFGMCLLYIVKKDKTWQVALKPIYGKMRIFCISDINLLFDIIDDDPFKYALAFDPEDVSMRTFVSTVRGMKAKGFTAWLHEKRIKAEAKQYLGEGYQDFLDSMFVLDA